MRSPFLKFIIFLFVVVAVFLSVLYFSQEKLIFFPEKLDKNYKFEFPNNFEELNIKTNDGHLLNGILFKSERSKGLVFYLHGNGGSINSWGDVANTYTDLNYDVFILDYRGYGKSEGKIYGQKQLFDDNQVAYNELKKRYNEDKIIVLGYSIGTGMAAQLASTNNPKLLILQAPYYNLTDLMKHNYPILPTFLLKYKFSTNESLKQCKMPVIIFHGNKDEVIYYGSSLKLKDVFKRGDTLITLKNQGHNGITKNQDYNSLLHDILGK